MSKVGMSGVVLERRQSDEMLRVAAASVVADVMQVTAALDGSDKGDVDEAMGLCSSSADLDLAVASSSFTRPDPASVSLRNDAGADQRFDAGVGSVPHLGTDSTAHEAPGVGAVEPDRER